MFQISTKNKLPPRTQIEGKIGTMKRYGLNNTEATLPYRVRMSELKPGLCLNLRGFPRELANAAAAGKVHHRHYCKSLAYKAAPRTITS